MTEPFIRVDSFVTELAVLINKFSLEQGCNTPDFILAEYLEHCLNAYITSVEMNRAWHNEGLK